MFSDHINLFSVCLCIFLCSMYYCLFSFNLGNVSNCIVMYLGIFVNETETETSLRFFANFLATF